MAEPIIRKNGTNHPVYKMPSTYESERVTYGDSNVKDELDAINSNLSAHTYDYSNRASLTKGVDYTTPSDGYLLISYEGGVSREQFTVINCGSYVFYQESINPSGALPHYMHKSIYVRKGMTFNWDNTSTNYLVSFVPLA